MNEESELGPTTAPVAAADIETSDVERLFREHNSALLRFISAKMGSEQEAREIAQEAYVHLLQLNHPETVSYLRAFLFKTAANLAIDRLRQRGRRSHVTSMPEVDFAVFELTPERQVAGEQSLSAIGSAVAQLPAKCRQAFLLHRIYELPIDEIAQRMGIGACMVRRYIARALEYIRGQLDLKDERQARDRP
jgi:RNA polymerase sigma-70 factor (ECF subfamily)